MAESGALPAAGTGWHRALTCALVGEVSAAPTATDRVDLNQFLADLGGVQAVVAHRRTQAVTGRVWPHPVPPELRAGLGPAQFQALLQQAVAAVLSADPTTDRPVVTSRSPTPTEQRLLQDVPPHHGS